MKRAAIYVRVSTVDQNLQTQLLDLGQMASQRGFGIVREYRDQISGAKARRPGLDEMLRDARRGRFDVLLVWAFDRLARSVVHFLQVLDELNHLGIEFISFREQIDTGGPLGRAVVVIVGAWAGVPWISIAKRSAATAGAVKASASWRATIKLLEPPSIACSRGTPQPQRSTSHDQIHRSLHRPVHPRSGNRRSAGPDPSRPFPAPPRTGPGPPPAAMRGRLAPSRSRPRRPAQRHRPAVCTPNHRLLTGVPKTCLQTPAANPTKSAAGSHRSGCSTNCTL